MAPRRKLSKLTQLTFDEARVRLSQKVAAVKERRGWSSLTRLPDSLSSLLNDSITRATDDDELRSYFQSRTRPTFFAGMVERADTLKSLRDLWPTAESAIRERADRITAGTFDLLGLEGLSFGDPLDWHIEPISKKRAPFVHWSAINYLDAEVAGDTKIIWELNRHQYFITLGQAYWLTNDERYARTFDTHLNSWMDHNPPKLGINWASNLEVAFRSISWLWAFHFFKDSTSFSSHTFSRALKFLYLNALHLETYLSTYFSPNTHLTGEALGLFYLGTMLPEFKESRRWRSAGRQILLEQLPRHVRPDGVYFEQSSYYHRYTTDFYTHFLILARLNDQLVPAEVEEKLMALLDHLMYITRPDGTTPLFGDDDGGRVVMLDRRPANDFRAALATGAVLFDRPDYKFVSGGPAEETLWLLGATGLQHLDQVEAREPAKQSVGFENGGYYVLRDGWTRQANYLLFDCGPHGQANCGHAHADALAIDVAAKGRTLLVDPGTYTYTGARELRDWFRNSSAHNCLTVDGESSSVSQGPFSWKSIANCMPHAFVSRDQFDYVSGAHDGYQRLPRPLEHERSILFLKGSYWIIRDHVKSSENHNLDLWFHFDCEASPLIEAPEGHEAFISETSAEPGLDVAVVGANGRWRREEGWVSRCYAQRAPARVYVYSACVAGSKNLTSFLLPRTANSAWSVRQVETVGGQGFEIVGKEWLDIVLIRVGEWVECSTVASDFEWTWARFSRSKGLKLEGLVLIDGTTLELEGKRILNTERKIRYLSARDKDGKLTIDSDSELPAIELTSTNIPDLLLTRMSET